MHIKRRQRYCKAYGSQPSFTIIELISKHVHYTNLKGYVMERIQEGKVIIYQGTTNEMYQLPDK